MKAEETGAGRQAVCDGCGKRHAPAEQCSCGICAVAAPEHCRECHAEHVGGHMPDDCTEYHALVRGMEARSDRLRLREAVGLLHEARAAVRPALPAALFLNYAEAAALLGIKAGALRERVSQGRVPKQWIKRMGRRVQFVRAAIEAAVKS